MDACEIVQQMDDDILNEPERWGKNTRVGYDQETSTEFYCLMGALSLACTGNAVRIPESGSGLRVYQEVRDALCATIDSIDGPEFYGRLGEESTAKIVAFNDDKNTTFEKVKEILKRTRDNLCR